MKKKRITESSVVWRVARKVARAFIQYCICTRIGFFLQVFLGTKERTSGGLKKSDLTKNRDGKVVSKKASDRAKKTGKHIAKFGKAVAQARKSLGIKGFVPVGGKTARGQALLKKARSLYKK